MNTKVIFALIIVLMVAIFGYSQYSSAKHEEQLAAMKAESAKVQAETARLEAEQNQEKQTKLKQQQEELQAQESAAAENNAIDKAAKTQLVNNAKRFSDLNNLAQNTPRISLAPIVKDLQTLRRETENIKVGDCTKLAKDNLVGAMKTNEEDLIAFMASADSGNPQFFKYAEQLVAYAKELGKCGTKI